MKEKPARIDFAQIGEEIGRQLALAWHRQCSNCELPDSDKMLCSFSSLCSAYIKVYFTTSAEAGMSRYAGSLVSIETRVGIDQGRLESDVQKSEQSHDS
ncbi:MAG: hypothetical protein ACYC3G_00775 [Minisyncoccota bacterium]